MKPPLRTRVLAGLALAASGVAAGLFAAAPTGCASDCASHCPIAIATIETNVNVDPGILEIAWQGPACPAVISCRGDDRNTFCNHINVTADAQGYCDVLLRLDGRESMAVRLQFGPPATEGCCRGFPVVGESYFTIPLSMDAGIQGADGPSDAVRVLRDGGAADATDDGGDAATGDGAAAD